MRRRKRTPRRPLDHARAFIRAIFGFPLFILRAFLVAFAAAFGGVPRIEDPERKNKIVMVRKEKG